MSPTVLILILLLLLLMSVHSQFSSSCSQAVGTIVSVITKMCFNSASFCNGYKYYIFALVFSPLHNLYKLFVFVFVDAQHIHTMNHCDDFVMSAFEAVFDLVFPAYILHLYPLPACSWHLERVLRIHPLLRASLTN